MTGYQSKKAMSQDRLFVREAAVDYLVESDFQYIINGDGMGLELLRGYLEDGFKGYGNFTDEELQAEVKEREWMEKQ